MTPAQTALRRRCSALLSSHRRRAKKDGAVLDYDLEDLVFLATRHQQCFYCRAPLGLDFSIDHMIPTARGGRHAAANLCLCCRSCNTRKGQLTATEYRELLALLASWHPAAQEDVRRRLSGGGAAVYARRRKRV